MLYVIFRIAFAVFVATVLTRLLLKLLRLNKFLKDDRESNRNRGFQDDCIDLCPECGRVREKNHRCP